MDRPRAHFRFYREQNRQQVGSRRCYGHCVGNRGAVAGGWLFNTIGHVGVTGVNLYSILVAVVGAVIVLLLYHAVVGSHARV
jgi:Transglycosylase associated protein